MMSASTRTLVTASPARSARGNHTKRSQIKA
jgi:hypothetical protein